MIVIHAINHEGHEEHEGTFLRIPELTFVSLVSFVVKSFSCR
jgi:hypothetical protein